MEVRNEKAVFYSRANELPEGEARNGSVIGIAAAYEDSAHAVWEA